MVAALATLSSSCLQGIDRASVSKRFLWFSSPRPSSVSSLPQAKTRTKRQPRCKMADIWTCCQCKSPNLECNATRCPICSHDKCSECVVGRPGLSATAPSSDISFASLTSPATSYNTPRYSPHNGSSRCHRHSTSSAATQNYHHTYAAYTAPVSYSSRPNMAGWWVCCCCQQANNPALAPQRCPVDGHIRSQCCYTYPR